MARKETIDHGSLTFVLSDDEGPLPEQTGLPCLMVVSGGVAYTVGRLARIMLSSSPQTAEARTRRAPGDFPSSPRSPHNGSTSLRLCVEELGTWTLR